MSNPVLPSSEEAEARFEKRMEAISESIRKYHDYLEVYIYEMTGQWQDAENLVQDLWSYVLLRFKDDQIDSLPLLRRKAYHLFIDHYRKNVRRGESLTDSVPDNVVQTVAAEAYTDAEEIALKKNFWSEYLDINLTDQQKEVLWLNARYGLTHKEIEKETGIPSSTVGDWIILARKRLGDAMDMKS